MSDAVPTKQTRRRGDHPAAPPSHWFPDRWGRWTWWATGAAFLLLTVAVVRGVTSSWDTGVTSAAVAARTPALTRIAVAVSWLGSTGPLAVWAGTAALVLDRRYATSWRCLLRVLAVLLVDVVVVFAIKNQVQRPRPPADLHLVTVSTLSFPSGHATATAAAVSMLLLCLAALPSSRRALRWAVAAGVVAAVAMDWSRVYLGVHYVSDVVAGTILGVWLALSTLWVFDALPVSRATRRAGSRRPTS